MSAMSGASHPMSLAGIRRALVQLMESRGRRDLAQEALGGVVFTDDGATIYVHVLARPSWPRRRPGQAYVLAYAEKAELCGLADWRALLQEAGFLVWDEIAGICRWFDGN